VPTASYLELERFDFRPVSGEGGARISEAVPVEARRLYLACDPETGMLAPTVAAQNAFSEGMAGFCDEHLGNFVAAVDELPGVSLWARHCDAEGVAIPVGEDGKELLDAEGYLIDENGYYVLDDAGEEIQPQLCGCDEFGDNVTGFMVRTFNSSLENVLIPVTEYEVDWKRTWGHNLFGYAAPTYQRTVYADDTTKMEKRTLAFMSGISATNAYQPIAFPLPGGFCVGNAFQHDKRRYGPYQEALTNIL